LLIFLFNLQFAFSLGIGPGKQVVDFKPGLELEYSFKVYADSIQEIELYSAGEFADLVEFDKKELIGSGEFKVKIKLPNEIEKPGEHIILIGARERTSKQIATVGTSVAVQAPIVVKVPYPGKYAEISFSAQNANFGEPINFEVRVASMGKEPISATTSIEIYSGEEKIKTLELGTKIIENQKEDVFKIILDTNEYKSGNYNAIAIVDYQAGTAKQEQSFKIGQLFVNVTNYTNEIIKQGIKPFEIHIESLWNDPIENVYGEVNVLENNISVADFLTPSVELGAWEKKTLLGYLDTEKLNLKKYDLEIKINYQEETTVVNGELNVKAKSDYKIYLIAGILLLLILIVFMIFKDKFSKNEKKNKKAK